ncbi:MAG: EAL domain-containing protein [Gammaproteobacteria bacterium]|nr:EAL domain-containing protein [Gammaproteobacteria bacterium]
MNQNLLLKTSMLHLVVSAISVAACAGLVLGTRLPPALLVILLAAVIMVCTGIFYVLHHILKLDNEKHASNEKQQLQLALDSAGECLWEWQLANKATSIHFSTPYCMMLGYTRKEFAHDQKGWQELLHPDEREHVLRRLTRLFAEGKDSTYENTYRMRHKDGSYRWIHSRGRLFTNQGKLVRFIGIAADISEERHNNERLRLANVVFDSTHEGVLISDANNIVVFVNRAFSDITGYSYTEIVGNSPRVLKSGRHSKEFYTEMWRSLDNTDSWTGEIWNRRKNGEVLPQLQTITQLRDEHGLITHRVAVFSDISLLKSSQSEISFLAHYDPLTSLPNRALLHEHLKLSLQRAIKFQSMAALLMINLDHFKIINESLGHINGDELLKQVTARIQQVLDPQDTLSRFGGDEFAIVADSCNDNVQAANTAEQILTVFRKPFLIGQQDIFVTVSIGICMYPLTGLTAEEVLRYAATALSKAKDSGRDSYAFYDSILTEAAAKKLRIANELRTAIDDSQLTIHYQPVYSLDDKKIIGCEALVRWQHPQQGLLMPAEFISIAEVSGLIGAIDNWVMHQACIQAQQWQQLGLALEFISVNISSRLFDRSGTLKANLQEALLQSGLPAHHLELEITESSMMGNPAQSIELLHELRSTGVRLAIDDFGTGYSSLGRLKHLPVDKFKIDRTFVMNLPHDPADIAIIRAIISLSESLDLQVQAEGVETREQAEFLQQYPQVLAQGYLYGKPMPAADFAAMLAAQQPSPNSPQ